MEWDALALFTKYFEHIKTALLLITPIASAWGSWLVAHRKLKAEAEDRDLRRRNDEISRINTQREQLHDEMKEQNDSLTLRFKAIMDASEERNRDLREEVMSLRQEVSSLRKAIDRQRVVCADCPRLKLLLITYEDPDAASLPAPKQ